MADPNSAAPAQASSRAVTADCRIRNVYSKIIFTIPIFGMSACRIIYVTPEGSYQYTIIFENTRACVDRSRECKGKFAILGLQLAGKESQANGKKKKLLHVCNG